MPEIEYITVKCKVSIEDNYEGPDKVDWSDFEFEVKQSTFVENTYQCAIYHLTHELATKALKYKMDNCQDAADHRFAPLTVMRTGVSRNTDPYDLLCHGAYQLMLLERLDDDYNIAKDKLTNEDMKKIKKIRHDLVELARSKGIKDF